MAVSRPDPGVLTSTSLRVGWALFRLAAALLVLWLLAEVVLLAFAAVLLAIVLRALARQIEAHTPLSSAWALVVAVIAVSAVIAGFVLLLGTQIHAQGAALIERLPHWSTSSANACRSPPSRSCCVTACRNARRRGRRSCRELRLACRRGRRAGAAGGGRGGVPRRRSLHVSPWTAAADAAALAQGNRPPARQHRRRAGALADRPAGGHGAGGRADRRRAVADRCPRRPRARLPRRHGRLRAARRPDVRRAAGGAGRDWARAAHGLLGDRALRARAAGRRQPDPAADTTPHRAAAAGAEPVLDPRLRRAVRTARRAARRAARRWSPSSPCGSSTCAAISASRLSVPGETDRARAPRNSRRARAAPPARTCCA